MRLTATTAGDGAVAIAIEGELEAGSAQLLADEIAKATADRPAELRLDLSDLVFVDSTGLGTILAARAALSEHTTLRIVGARGNVVRTFQRAGLARLLEEQPLDG